LKIVDKVKKVKDQLF